ncbi:hypothetical protein SACS_1457 [Parasaccharibacter apium]|uniref:Uncharacterized protein n=1 Tax=Parasaccharibacter apium TaxID=1510841 RepID=A0A7U7G6R7_9PROT|nr:hypothetical protein SACS_1457 [Parasaccharibacter apium]
MCADIVGTDHESVGPGSGERKDGSCFLADFLSFGNGGPMEEMQGSVQEKKTTSRGMGLYDWGVFL